MEIASDLYQAIVAHARSGFPEEVCGLVAGENGRAVRVIEIENILHSPVAYEMDPVQQVRAMVGIEAQGLEMLAIYHSHPSGPAAPSATDVAQAYYPDTIQIIVSLVAFEEPEAAAFYIAEGRVEAAVLRIS